MMQLADVAGDDEMLLEQSARDPEAFAIFYRRPARARRASAKRRIRAGRRPARPLAEPDRTPFIVRAVGARERKQPPR